jgi:hypothetical protein
VLHVSDDSSGFHRARQAALRVAAGPALMAVPTMEATSIPGVLGAVGAHLAVGGVLFYGVEKFFAKVEEKLNDGTKLEIAVWLLGVGVSQKLEPWPDTFARVFDRVFGEKHLTLRCFLRSSVVSFVVVFSFLLLSFFLFDKGKPHTSEPDYFVGAVVLSLLSNLLPDYISLLETRLMLRFMRRTSAWRVQVPLLLVDAVITAIVAVLGIAIGYSALGVGIVGWETGESPGEMFYGYRRVLAHLLADPWRMMRPIFGSDPHGVGGAAVKGAYFYAAFFTSIWLWAYAGAGFLLKGARRLDVGFAWFNRRFDIEKKPLSSIGLVAGALCAAVYWAWCLGAAALRS